MTPSERPSPAAEWGEYLAKAAEQYQTAVNDALREITIAENGGQLDEGVTDTLAECYRALSSAIYEFRKRASGRPPLVMMSRQPEESA